MWGPATNPFQTIEAAASGRSLGVPSRPEASSARISEAKARDQSADGSAERATYSGLIPSGSRASRRRRRRGSQEAKANMPRSDAIAPGPCVPSARTSTAVSPVDRKLWPEAMRQSRSSR